MLQNHSPFVEEIKSFFLAHPKIFFTYLFVFPALLSLLTPPLLLLLFFFPLYYSFSHLSLCVLVFVLSNFQFWIALFSVFLLTAFSIWNISCFFPLHNSSVFFLSSVVGFYFVSSPLHITVSVFAILHHLDCWNYFSLSFSGALWFGRSVKDCFYGRKPVGNVQVCHRKSYKRTIYEVQPPPATLIHGFTLFSSCCDYSPALCFWVSTQCLYHFFLHSYSKSFSFSLIVYWLCSLYGTG